MSSSETPDRWTLIRDILVFQLKLVVDGLRDFILVPVSLVLGVVSLVKGGNRPGTEFYDLLRYGRHTDRAINLFGAAERVHPPDDDAMMPNIDDVLGRVEDYVVEEYRRGGITAQAKERLDRALDTLNRRHRDRGDDEPSG
jgi:hypothetical protein